MAHGESVIMKTKLSFISLFFILSIFLFSCGTKPNKVLDVIDQKVKDAEENIPDSKKINKDYYFIYYAADWCPYCKEFRDELVKFYDEYKEKYNNFEIILVGSEKDKSNEDLIKYMKNDNLPFYYLDFDYRDECGFFKLEDYKVEKFYIPGFLLVDRDFNVLASSNGPKKEDYIANKPLIYYINMMAKLES